MKPNTTRTVYAVHKWAGLICSVNMLLLSVTAVALLTWDLLPAKAESAGEAFPEHVIPLGEGATIDDALAALLQQEPEGAARIFRVEVPAGLETGARILVKREDEFISYAYDAAKHEVRHVSGSVLGQPAEEAEADRWAAFRSWLFRLHDRLLLGDVGIVIVGLFAAALLAIAVSGLLIYTPFMRKNEFGNIRRSRMRRVSLSDWHKFVGIVCLAFNIIIAGTGIIMNFGILASRGHDARVLAAYERERGPINAAAPLPDFSVAYAAATAAADGRHVYLLQYPVPDTVREKVFRAYMTKEAGAARVAPRYMLLARDDSLERIPGGMPSWGRVYIASFSLHMGSFGGKAVKAAYWVLSLATAFLSVSGVLLFAFKREKRTGRAPAVADALSPGSNA